MIPCKKNLLLFVIITLFLGCKERPTRPSDAIGVTQKSDSISVKYAKSFSIDHHGNYVELHVHRPWPGAKKPFRYLVIPRKKLAEITFPKDAYDGVITTPITSLVATSTTHIPALESLNALEKLIGFPDTKYISSMPARELIAMGKIKELGNNDRLNTELVLELRPDLIVGFGIDDQNSPYESFQKAGIPVVYNGDWTEETPLGKAEWIKFFGVLLDKEKEADSLFREIETSYLDIKALALNANTTPTVLSGSLYKDIWYAPAGASWAAQFINDAHADYLYKDVAGTGSLSLSLESVLEKAQSAEYWVTTAQFTGYKEMQQGNNHYLGIKPFRDKKVHTSGATKGATGGLLYYELAPQRPDLVLKDLVHIFHPELLPDHTPYFFTPLH